MPEFGASLNFRRSSSVMDDKFVTQPAASSCAAFAFGHWISAEVAWSHFLNRQVMSPGLKRPSLYDPCQIRGALVPRPPWIDCKCGAGNSATEERMASSRLYY